MRVGCGLCPGSVDRVLRSVCDDFVLRAGDRAEHFGFGGDGLADANGGDFVLPIDVYDLLCSDSGHDVLRSDDGL